MNPYEKITETFLGGFWFIPLIIGLYPITPLLKVFTKTATTKDYTYFFVFWFITASVIPTLSQSFGINITVQLPLIWQYIGYFVAGHFFSNKIIISKKILSQIHMLFITVSTLITLGTYRFTKLDKSFYSTLYEYTNILVVISSISGFITLKSFFQKITKKISKNTKAKISKISQSSLGIFLSHALILDIFTFDKLGIGFRISSSNLIITLPVVTILVFSISLFLIIGLEKTWQLSYNLISPTNSIQKTKKDPR